MVGTRGVRRTQAADAEHHEAANDRVAVGRPQAAKIVGRQAKRTGGVARAPSQESIPQVAEDAHRSEAGASAAVTAGESPCITLRSRSTVMINRVRPYIMEKCLRMLFAPRRLLLLLSLQVMINPVTSCIMEQCPMIWDSFSSLSRTWHSISAMFWMLKMMWWVQLHQ
ncbi:hypothetical protein AB1Y20_010137 [Prymnesium parvum]|uniref:Uncharacterized protein n=1 Tax=Prymnesium parvum TaxID=97485 RepID=A0AB34K464_PRYPA